MMTPILQSPFSKIDPKTLISFGNENGLDPQKSYKEYGIEGAPLREPVPYGKIPSAFPTNKWYQDLSFLAKQRNTIPEYFQAAVSPFNVRVLDSVMTRPITGVYTDLPGLEINTPKTPYLSVTGKPTTYGLNADFSPYTLGVDIALALGIAVGDETTTPDEIYRTIAYQDQFTFNTEWKNNKLNGSITTLLSRGAPYITFEYSNMPIILTGLDLLTISTDEGVHSYSLPDSHAPNQQSTFTGKTFKIVLGENDFFASTQKNYYDSAGNLTSPPLYSVYMLYFSDEITLEFTPTDSKHAYQTLTAINNQGTLKPFTGILRVAYVDSVTGNVGEPAVPAAMKVDFPQKQQQLTRYSNVYPVSAALSLEKENGTEAVQNIEWTTASFDNGSGNNDLMMMAFKETHCPFLLNPKTIPELSVKTLRGDMVAVIGNTWVLKIDLPFELEDENLWSSRNSISTEYTSLIKNKLLEEFSSILKDLKSLVAIDSYDFGKRVGRASRLALIADELEETSIRDQIITVLKDKLSSWFSKTINPSDPDGNTIQGFFKYDNKFGGVCPAKALADPSKNTKYKCCGYNCDYYSGQYTDHHFHFGYFLYASATISKFDSQWKENYKELVNLLARDIANPSTDDPYFPQYRYFDWFEGHGFANGLGPQGQGRNQESTSEALNAWYALALWGQQIGNTNMQALGQIMGTLEIRAAKAWTQITKNSFYNQYSIIPHSLFNKTDATVQMSDSVMTGINWSLSVQHTTFFGNKLGFLVGIQIMPYTQITNALISNRFVKDNQTQLSSLLNKLTQDMELFENVDNAVNEFGAESSEVPVSINDYWIPFQGVLNDWAHGWFLIVKPIMAMVDKSEAYQSMFQTIPGIMNGVNNAFNSSPRVKKGKDCNVPNNKDVGACVVDNNNIDRTIGLPFALDIYDSMDKGESQTNILWYLATCNSS